MIQNGVSIDGYIIQDCISTNGGMSSIYLAQIAKNKRKVVLKVALTNKHATTHEDVLLQREAELLQKSELRHPGNVRLFPIPLQNRRPQYVVRASSLPEKPWYMVMEYLQGKSLKDTLKMISKYSLEWKLELFYRMLLPISFLHSQGYAHRDIKPDNIMFRVPISPNHLPDPVFIDFALATDGKDYSPIVTDSYTLGYASPERIINAMATLGDSRENIEDIQASDVWSLGVVLYEILTGEILFRGSKEKVKTTIIRQQMKPALPISGEKGKILAAFIQSMLKKDARKRPEIGLIIDALEQKFLPPHLDIQ
ncbi:MAG: serine/threonine protein kinase [Candidatus Methanofastidiosia archaeon]